ncbi:MAG: alginate lyase family protein [Gammaproteobacteria bacterium]|nr:alginate lyase family protein [Gammaproteobacteria bacterium]
MLSRYWHTLRYLRPIQFYGRLWFRLYRPRPELQPAPMRRLASRAWAAPPLRPVSMLGPTRFRFLNQTHDVPGPESWNAPTLDKLWLYNLHYFDDLNAQDAQARADWHRALIERWIAENPPGRGNGWEPYPTSLRIVNWVKYLGAVAGGEGTEAGRQGGTEKRGADACLVPQCLGASVPSTSLAIQARWLRKRLEHHLLGNHLFANAKALVFAGAFFDGPEAEQWLALGQCLLRRELNEQILPDGGHFERSPMYHAILLEDVLDVLNLAGVYPGVLDDALLARCGAKAVAMLDWLAAMTHPDGEISFFNDAAFGIAPPLADLGAYAKHLGIGARPESGGYASLNPPYSTRHSGREAGIQGRESNVAVTTSAGVVSEPTIHGRGPGFPAGTTDVQCCWLRDSGYVCLQAGPAVALLDVAPIGPDYLPGHAHADTLSFELSLFGQRVIVNGGTSRYGSGPERLAERGTAAHSTVQIDGVDSSEVWGGFRVARRARPFDVIISPEMAEMGMDPDLSPILVSAAHDGYRRLPGRPVHRRQWQLAEDRLVVTDRIEGVCRSAIARFHLHPQVEGIEPSIGEACGTLRLANGACIHWRVTGGHPRLVPDTWHPEFGRSVPSQCLEVVMTADQCAMELTWAASGPSR